MENKYIVYKNDYNKLCNYGFNDVNLQLDSSIDDYISSNIILIGGNNKLEQYGGDIIHYLVEILSFFVIFYIWKELVKILYSFVMWYEDNINKLLKKKINN